MSKKQYTWEFDETEERWFHDKFDTVDECVSDYVENYSSEKPQYSIAVGEVKPFVISVECSQVIESIVESACDECGECAESWDPSDDKTRADWEDLSDQLSKVVVDWLKKHNDMPSFYSVEDIRKIAVSPKEGN